MNYFVIRQKSTGLFMPAIPGRAGGTRLEPSNDPPRLFSKEQYARYALRHWLEGGKTVHYDYDGDLSSDHITKVPSRNPDDMEIVKVQIVVIS